MATPHDDDAPPATDTVTADELDLVDRLDREATPGPWIIVDSESDEIIAHRPNDRIVIVAHVPDEDGQDARFIATARTLLPRLARALRAIWDDADPYVYQQGVIDGRKEAAAEYARGRREAIEEAAQAAEECSGGDYETPARVVIAAKIRRLGAVSK